MKRLMICALFALSASMSAFAADEKKEENFAKNKTEALSRIDKHISTLQEHRSCVSAASDKDAMKVCHEKMKDFRQEMRSEHMENKHERMGERMKRHEEKMKKKSEKK